MAINPLELKMLLGQAQTKLVGASESGLKAELYDVLKEFFEDSNCWREDIVFSVSANKDTYSLAPAEDGQIIRLIGTWDDKNSPVQAFMPEFAVIKLVHAPSSDPPGKWTSRVIKTVTLPITKNAVPAVPEWYLRVYGIHILDGLLGKMMGQQQKTYSNNNLSVYHLRRFRTGIQLAKVATEQGNLLGAQNWSYPGGWGRGSQRGRRSLGAM